MPYFSPVLVKNMNDLPVDPTLKKLLLKTAIKSKTEQSSGEPTF
jgi:hypothetical protein